MPVFLAADLEAIPGTKPSSGGSPTPAASNEHLETWAPVPPSTGSASVVAETGPAFSEPAFVAPAFVAPAFTASAPAAPAVTASGFTASAVTAPAFTASGPSGPAFTFAPEQVGTVALNGPASGSSVAAMDPQFFSFGSSAFSYGGSSDVIENWGQNADGVGPAVFHFVEAANWSASDSDSGGSWFTDWLYDLLV